LLKINEFFLYILYSIDMYEKANQAELDKLRYSFYSAVVFFILATPFMFKLVDSVLGSVVPIASSSGCPTYAGVFVHAVVFGLVVYGLMHLDI